MGRYSGKKADPFYLSANWKRLRKAALERDHYLCRRCKRRVATVVHHILPVKEYPEKMRDLDNLESVCAMCHNLLHPEKGAAVNVQEELPVDVRIIDLDARRKGKVP